MASAAQAGASGPLSFIGCMREASPPPLDFQQQQHHHHHHHQRPQGLPSGAPDYAHLQHGFDSVPKEPKKRRFHPLRGLRRIFRKKSRGAADSRPADGEGGAELGALALRHDREEITLRDPAGRPDEIRSRSASELLTDSCDRERRFLPRRRGLEESLLKLRRNSGQLSVSHDSVFPGEAGHARALSSLDDLQPSSLERRTAKASAHDADQAHQEPPQKHRISLRVLEQIKTAIENRNQIAASTSTTTTPTTSATESTSCPHSRFSGRDRSSSGGSAARTSATNEDAKVPRKDAPTSSSADSSPATSPLKEDLPEPTSGQLSHTAALHRISVRPRNRRPPRRSNSSGAIGSEEPAAPARPRVDSVSENSIDTLDSLEGADPGAPEDSPEPPAAPTPAPLVRKSSSRGSRDSEVFEEPAQAGAGRRVAVSPDSLEANPQGGPDGDAEAGRAALPRPSPRSASVGSDGSERPPRRPSASSSHRLSKSPDSLEGGSPGWLAKSSEAFDKLGADGDAARDKEQPAGGRPVPAKRLLLQPTSQSQERVGRGKSCDSLEALGGVGEPTERRRSSFEMRRGPQRAPVHKLMSKSTECFEASLQREPAAGERPARASLSELNLSRREARAARPPPLLAGARRVARSSDSSDNPEPEEGGRAERRGGPRRPQKSSESSELGSSDTLDWERRHAAKSSGSDETLDSLEKELAEQSSSSEQERAAAEEEGPRWRRRAASHESAGLDIHQLLAFSLASRAQDNGNDDEGGPKRGLQQRAACEDNATVASTIGGLLSPSADEDLQNMLNGNISEVSTDTKSFKEKLIMFEKLGK